MAATDDAPMLIDSPLNPAADPEWDLHFAAPYAQLVLCSAAHALQDSAVEHARSLGMADELIVRAMICACFKHPLHRTAILRRTCLGCSCASSVVTECFDNLVPRLWSRLTTPFQMAFIDLLHDCCKMGLGDLPRMGISVVAALVVQATSDSPASPSLTRLLTVLRSPDFSSSHATPALATALLHAAICFRSEPPVAAACADAAGAIVDVCCRSEGGGAGVALAFRDGSTVALAWCALHIFVDTVTVKAGRAPPASDASVACNAVWSQLHDAGVVAAQAAALCAVVHRVEVGSPPLLITQRLNRVLDALPLQPCDDARAQPDADAACVIPWPIQHHLSWMLQVPVESELLLQQLVHVWISRSSFRPLWVLQCAVQSPGDPCRRWFIARMLLLHIKCVSHAEAVVLAVMEGGVCICVPLVTLEQHPDATFARWLKPAPGALLGMDALGGSLFDDSFFTPARGPSFLD